MLMQEFIDRTGYTPDDEEYGLIEQSYYDFNGDKDEFCSAWKKAKKSGAWDREAELLRVIAGLKHQQASLAEQLVEARLDLKQASEDRDYFHNIANDQAKEISNLQEELHTEKARPHGDIEIHDIAENEHKNIKAVQFVNRKDIQFITVEELNGWMTSYRIDGLTGFRITVD